MSKREFIEKYQQFIPEDMKAVFLRDLKALAAEYSRRGESVKEERTKWQE